MSKSAQVVNRSRANAEGQLIEMMRVANDMKPDFTSEDWIREFLNRTATE